MRCASWHLPRSGPDTIVVENGPTWTFDELGRLTSLSETVG